jgi:hypothetical protein
MNKQEIMTELTELLDLARQIENKYMERKIQGVIESLNNEWTRDEYYYQELLKISSI